MPIGHLLPPQLSNILEIAQNYLHTYCKPGFRRSCLNTSLILISMQPSPNKKKCRSHIVRIQVIKGRNRISRLKNSWIILFIYVIRRFFSKTDLSRIISAHYSLLWFWANLTAVLTLFNQWECHRRTIYIVAFLR